MKSEIRIVEQSFLCRKWSLVQAGLFDRALFKIALGLLGRLEYVSLSESIKELRFYIPVIDNRVSYARSINGDKVYPFANGGFLKHAMCRCSLAPVLGGRDE